jgi:hypothetical protein
VNAAARGGLPNEEELIRRIYAGRERWVDLGDGKEVCVRRPDEWDSLSVLEFVGKAKQLEEAGFKSLDRIAKLASLRIGSEPFVDRFCRQVTDWRGFTEADLLGEGVGTIDPVSFSPRLFRVVAGDQLKWLVNVYEAVVELVIQHSAQKADTAKN